MMHLNEGTDLAAPEADLVLRAGQGEFEAFETLILHYRRPVWRFVYRMLGNYEDTNDTVQQILIQVYISLPTLEKPSRFRAWLFMIARNKCMDHLRRKSSIPFSDFADSGGRDSPEDDEAGYSPLLLFPDPAPLPDELIERHETQQLLQKAIAALPERPRQVVALRYTTDLSFAEIGDALGMNENTVKTLFQRAKNQLRFFLRQRLYEYRS